MLRHSPLSWHLKQKSSSLLNLWFARYVYVESCKNMFHWKKWHKSVSLFFLNVFHWNYSVNHRAIKCHWIPRMRREKNLCNFGIFFVHYFISYSVPFSSLLYHGFCFNFILFNLENQKKEKSKKIQYKNNFRVCLYVHWFLLNYIFAFYFYLRLNWLGCWELCVFTLYVVLHAWICKK